MIIEKPVLFVNVEHNLQVGPKNCVEFTVIHQVILSKDDNGIVQVDIDLLNYTDIEFFGKKHESFKDLKEKLWDLMGIDIVELVDDVCVGLFSNKDIETLKLIRF
jgi:hypothetical protein